MERGDRLDADEDSYRLPHVLLSEGTTSLLRDFIEFSLIAMI